MALDLSALDPRNAQSVRKAAMDAWAFFDSSWVCPLCVAQTRALQVSWRLPLHFACVHHGVLHADTCPKCGKGANATIVANFGHCLDCQNAEFFGA